MEYARSYCLCNFRKKDPSKEISISNIEVIRGLEGSIGEQGFMLTHVDVAGHSPELVTQINAIYRNCE